MIYLELFWSFFQIGLFSIGGGYAAMPLIQNQVVDIHPWLTMTQFADIMTIAEMTPGPIAINSATFVGIQVAGLPGAVIATVGCVFPSCVIVMTLAYIYYRFRGLNMVQGILAGLRPAVIAMIASAGIVEIGESAFAEDGQYSDTTAGFISIVMPKTLKKVGKSAFQGTRITQIYFYDGLESIGDNAFMYCSSLSKIRIPDSVEKVGQFLFLGAGKPYEESQDSAMKIFGGKIAEELAKDNQRAEYGGEEMQEISIQYWLEKKENETKEEVIGQKYFDKNDTGFEKVFFKAPSSGEKQSGKIVWMDIFLGVCMVGLIGISVCLKD